MHNLHLLDNAQKYISITPQHKQPDNHVTQTMQTRKKGQIPQTSHHTNPHTNRTFHPTTTNTIKPHHNRTSRNRSTQTSRPRRLIPVASRNRNGRLPRHNLEAPPKRKKKSRPSLNRRTNTHSHRRSKLPRKKIAQAPSHSTTVFQASFSPHKKCYLAVSNFLVSGVQLAVQRKRHNINRRLHTRRNQLHPEQQPRDGTSRREKFRHAQRENPRHPVF